MVQRGGYGAHYHPCTVRAALRLLLSKLGSRSLFPKQGEQICPVGETLDIGFGEGPGAPKRPQGDPRLWFAGGIRGWQHGANPEQPHGQGSPVLLIGAVPAASPDQWAEEQWEFS